MRLLNATSMKLEEFFENSLSRYAILSHRWQDDEVSFQDMQNNPLAYQKAGYAKLKLCCDQAVKDGLAYAWVDTCCIDKTSSAELKESINSMYRWYKESAVCYAYLFDVHNSDGLAGYAKSAWFTRGWTIQELIAPLRVEFYNSVWENLGTKDALKHALSAVTGIDVEVLAGVDPGKFSVAKRMSWASKRTTTRVEDRSYSLLGIFGVNMPMLYGEGEKAFIRLQEEIMKQSDDHSLFAWTSSDHCYRGLLARSLSDFASCSDIVPSISRMNRAPYSITNMGLSIELPMVTWAMDTYLAALDCRHVTGSSTAQIGIFLTLLDGKTNQCARTMFEEADTKQMGLGLVNQCHYRKIFVRQQSRGTSPVDTMYGFYIRKLPSHIYGGQYGDRYSLHKAISWDQWDGSQDVILKIPVGAHWQRTAGVIWYKPAKRKDYSILRLGFDAGFQPVCQLVVAYSLSSQNKVIDIAPDGNFDETMKDEWTTGDGDQQVFRGARSTGLYFKKNQWRVSILKEKVGDLMMWVVDIED